MLSTDDTTITIRGRVFRVTTQTTPSGDLQYLLHGKRGALYGTLRNVHNRARLYLIDGRGFGIPSTMRGVWLSDEGGTLRVIEQ